MSSHGVKHAFIIKDNNLREQSMVQCVVQNSRRCQHYFLSCPADHEKNLFQGDDP
jgi:hypothetical protein